eukprot:3755975-Rhodomonas_salina.2
MLWPYVGWRMILQSENTNPRIVTSRSSAGKISAVPDSSKTGLQLYEGRASGLLNQYGRTQVPSSSNCVPPLALSRKCELPRKIRAVVIRTSTTIPNFILFIAHPRCVTLTPVSLRFCTSADSVPASRQQPIRIRRQHPKFL